MKLSRSRIIAAIAFLCLLAGSSEINDPKDAGNVLRAIEETTYLPVTEWAQVITGTHYAKPKFAKPRGLVDAAMEKMLEQQELEEAAKAVITLKNIQFTGVTILGDMELRGMVEPFINTPMTYEQMLEIGMVVEQYYRKNNYLARAILPPQDLTDGVLTVDVIESVFSKVEIEQELADLPNTQAHVEAIIQAQQPTGQVRTRQTEQTVDNAGSRSTGFMRFMASLTWFNLNDLADLLNMVAVHTRGNDYARMAYSLPVGLDGWRMGLNTSIMNYEVVMGQQGMVMSDDKAQVMSAQVAGFYRDLSPGGVTGIRAYPKGEGSGSDGQLLQLDLRHQLESGINLSTFYDWGQVWIQHDPNFPGGPINYQKTYKGFAPAWVTRPAMM